MNIPYRDDKIRWDQFLRVALTLKECTTDPDEELLEKAWIFLTKAYMHYRRYRYNELPSQTAFFPPLTPLDEVAVLLTGERSKVKARAALEKDLPSWIMERLRNNGGMNVEYCDQVKEIRRKWRSEKVREKQSQVGKRSKNLKHGKAPKKVY